MTELLEQAFARAKVLSSSQQDELASLLLTAMDASASTIDLTDAQRADLDRRLLEDDETVPSEDVRAELLALAK